MGSVSDNWRQRIDEVIACPDNQWIPRVPHAGELRDHLLTMHNGIQVSALGYYREGILNMLVENKGVHEPQEERAFAQVLPCLPKESTMLELGAYWGFYSLWFKTALPDSTCHLIEPDGGNLESGKYNFKLNQKEGFFTQAFIGSKLSQSLFRTPTITVDHYCQTHNVSHLQILHSDVQGFELEMLKGAIEMLGNGRIDIVFISTHSGHLHEDCLEFLKRYDYQIMASANIAETYSCDGLIVAKSPRFLALKQVDISLKAAR